MRYGSWFFPIKFDEIFNITNWSMQKQGCNQFDSKMTMDSVNCISRVEWNSLACRGFCRNRVWIEHSAERYLNTVTSISDATCASHGGSNELQIGTNWYQSILTWKDFWCLGSRFNLFRRMFADVSEKCAWYCLEDGSSKFYRNFGKHPPCHTPHYRTYWYWCLGIFGLTSIPKMCITNCFF